MVVAMGMIIALIAAGIATLTGIVAGLYGDASLVIVCFGAFESLMLTAVLIQ